MDDLKFEKEAVSSDRFRPGVWLVTRCIENDRVVSVDLGWKDAGADGNYRQIGDFKHESEALFSIRALEALSAVPDIKTTMSEAGFVKRRATGLSYGQEPYVHEIQEGRLSALLDFDINGTRLYLVRSGGAYATVEIATLHLRTGGTSLSALGRPEAIAATVLCALLKARIEAGDATRSIPADQPPNG